PVGQLDAQALAAVLVTGPAPRLLDEDLPHGPRRGAEEVSPALPAGILVPDQPQVGLVNQGGRLERLPGAQLVRQRLGQAAQLVVDRRHQVGRRPSLLRLLLLTRRHAPSRQVQPRGKNSEKPWQSRGSIFVWGGSRIKQVLAPTHRPLAPDRGKGWGRSSPRHRGG